MVTVEGGTTADIPAIRELATTTWHATYRDILSVEQLDYMLDVLYSENALQAAMTSAERFLLLREAHQPKGFVSYAPRKEDPAVIKIHKLYVLPDTQGKGFGRRLVDEVKAACLQQRIFGLELNVNRYNPARHFYERMGFRMLREEDIPIGPYWMNDYVLRLDLHDP